MRIGLASFVCINKNLPFNLSQIEKAMQQVQGRVDVLCFGDS